MNLLSTKNAIVSYIVLRKHRITFVISKNKKEAGVNKDGEAIKTDMIRRVYRPIAFDEIYQNRAYSAFITNDVPIFRHG